MKVLKNPTSDNASVWGKGGGGGVWAQRDRKWRHCTPDGERQGTMYRAEVAGNRER